MLLTVWILATPPDWPYATTFVSVHLALTVISGLLIVREDSREIRQLTIETSEVSAWSSDRPMADGDRDSGGENMQREQGSPGVYRDTLGSRTTVTRLPTFSGR